MSEALELVIGKSRDEKCVLSPEKDQNVIYLAIWGLELTRRILSSISLSFWYWRGHDLIMDFNFDQSVAPYLKSSGSHEHVWSRIHSIFFRHYCQNMHPKRQVPFVVRRFNKNEILKGNIIRLYFEVEAWAGKCINGKLEEDDFYGNLTDENADMFKCQFMIQTEERR